jgi:hypothetical protein
MEANSSGQMGHPAAWIIANNRFPCNWFRAWTLSNPLHRGNLRTTHHRYAAIAPLPPSVVVFAISTRICG